MTIKSRISKLEEHAAQVGKAAARLIVAVGDHENQHFTYDGMTYTLAEWEAWKAANTKEEDNVLEVVYGAQPPKGYPSPRGESIHSLYLQQRKPT